MAECMRTICIVVLKEVDLVADQIRFSFGSKGTIARKGTMEGRRCIAQSHTTIRSTSGLTRMVFTNSDIADLTVSPDLASVCRKLHHGSAAKEENT